MTDSSRRTWWQRIAVMIARLEDHGFTQKMLVLALAVVASLVLSPLGLAGVAVGCLGSVLAFIALQRYGHRLHVESTDSAAGKVAPSLVEGVLSTASTWLRPSRLHDARLMLQAGVFDQALLLVLSDMTTIESTSEGDQKAILAAAHSVGPSRAIEAELGRLGIGGPITR